MIRVVGESCNLICNRFAHFIYESQCALLEKFNINDNNNRKSSLKCNNKVFKRYMFGLAVEFVQHVFWQRFIGICLIPYFPKSPNGYNNNNIPPLLKEPIDLSLTIWDLIQRFQPYMVCVHVCTLNSHI